MAAGMLHVAADIQSRLVHLRSNQGQVTLFSSSPCVFPWFVLSVEAERLKEALFSASGIRLLIPRKKIISNPAPV